MFRSSPAQNGKISSMSMNIILVQLSFAEIFPIWLKLPILMSFDDLLSY